MAVRDDLNRLAAQDVVYLRRSIPPGVREVFQGRLRQDNVGGWVFHASTGQSGVVGFELGDVRSNWSSSESPTSGIVVSILNTLYAPNAAALHLPPLLENVELTNVIFSEFTA